MNDESKVANKKRRAAERGAAGAPEDFTMDMLSGQHAAVKGGQLAAETVRAKTGAVAEDAAEPGADNADKERSDDQR